MPIITFDIAKRILKDPTVKRVEPYPVAICTPFYNSEPFIDKYLTYLTFLDWPRDLISLYFTVQGDDSTLDTLKRFEAEFSSDYRKIKIKKLKQVRGGELPHVRNVTRCRNNLIEWSKPDPILFIDHDNFPPPVSLKRLSLSMAEGYDIVGGVYPFYTRTGISDPTSPGTLGLTAFFMEGGQYHHTALIVEREDRVFDPSGRISSLRIKASINKNLLGKRIRAEATSMGTTLIRREVFKHVRFRVPWGTNWTDDTTFCLDAVKKGFKCVADFGLFVEHWGFRMVKTGEDNKYAHFDIYISEEMAKRRLKMHEDGVYVV